jgi:hypothetical protein
MPKPLKIEKNDAYQSVLQALTAVNPAIQKTLARLLQSVPMPLDAACLSLVCTGARLVVNAAFALIADRNSRAEEMLSDLIELEKACQKVYKDRGVADTAEAL